MNKRGHRRRFAVPADLEEKRSEFLSGIGVPDAAEFVPDPFQLEAVEHLVAGRDTLVVAPTGAGKTYIAIEAIWAVLRTGGRAIYTTPLKALSNTKYNEFKGTFEPQHSVGLLTGDRKIEGDSDVIIATTEIFRNELYEHSERYSLVVLDEVHFIADAQRGPVWEESIILAPSSSTLLMLSASISNPHEITEWLYEVRGKPCELVLVHERPIELRYGFLHSDWGVIPLRTSDGVLEPEIAEYYRDSKLDPEGLRLKGGRFDVKRHPGRGKWRGAGRHRRGNGRRGHDRGGRGSGGRRKS